MIADIRPLLSICLLLALPLLLPGCATSTAVVESPPPNGQQQIDDLRLAILAMGDDIDPDEAARAATIAIEYPLQLAQQYEISSGPLMHNFLVNIGVKPRGLCIHWTWDLLARLQQERFRSLDLHWGIANYENAFRLEHSTVIISAANDPMQQGLVLDPWRNAGRLFWARTQQDPSYQWRPHAEVHALKREREALALNRPAER